MADLSIPGTGASPSHPVKAPVKAPVSVPAAPPTVDNAAVIKALIAKQQTGKLTPDDMNQLKGLMAKAPEMQPGNLPVPTRADFDKARAKAAVDATARGATIPLNGQSWIQGPLVPIAKAGDMQVNPALTGRLGQPPDLAGVTKPAPIETEGPGVYNGSFMEAVKPVPGGALVPADSPSMGVSAAPATGAPPMPAAPATGAPPMPAAPATGAPPMPAAPADGTVSTEGDKPAPAPYTEPGKVSIESDAATPTVAEVKAVTSNTKSFGDNVKELAVKYGVPLLDIVQAFAYGKSGNVNTPTRLDTETQAKLAKEAKKFEADYMDKLETGRIKMQQDFAKQQQSSAQNFQVGQAGSAQTFTASQADKAQTYDTAKQTAQIEWESKNAGANRDSAKAIAEINAEATKKYYSIMADKAIAAGQGKVRSAFQQ